MSEDLSSVVDKYKQQFTLHGRSGTSLFAPKDRNKVRFSAIEKNISYGLNNWTLLDYGCGFGNLNSYLKSCRTDAFTYHGVDIVEEFINSNKNIEPEIDYKLICSYEDIKENYDYISIVGVFNMMYCNSIQVHKKIVQDTVKYLFSKCNKWISINFMTDDVGYVQGDAYHQNPVEFYNYAYNNLSKRIILDQSYLPYEFTITIYKDENRSESDAARYLNE